MNAELSRALPDERCRLASSVIATVIVSPGSSVMMPASVVVGIEMCRPFAATNDTTADATNDAVSSKTCDVIVKPLEGQRDQPDEQADRRADDDVVVAAAEEPAAGSRHDAVAEDAQPPRDRSASSSGSCRCARIPPAATPFPSSTACTTSSSADRRPRFSSPGCTRIRWVCWWSSGPNEAMMAVGVVKNCPTMLQPVADLLQDLFEAVRRVAGRVERMPEAQHEQRRMALVEVWLRHGQRIYDRQVDFLFRSLPR